jgi:hypothetical protein
VQLRKHCAGSVKPAQPAWQLPTWVLQLIEHVVKFWSNEGTGCGMGVVIVACARRILPSARNVSELQMAAIAVTSTSVRRLRIEGFLRYLTVAAPRHREWIVLT